MITIDEKWFPVLTAGVLIAYLIFVIKGARKGFLLQILSLAATILTFLGAWRYSSVLSKYFGIWPKNLNPVKGTVFAETFQTWMNQMACFILLVIVFRILFALLEKLAQGLSRAPVLRQISETLGALLGAFSCTIWVLVFAMILETPVFSNGAEAVSKSAVGVITSAVSDTFDELGVPLNTAQAINKVYKDAKSLDDKDQKALENWLDSHGFETIEQQQMEDLDES